MDSVQESRRLVLLPCPFCGARPVLDNLGDDDSWYVHCTGCEVQQIANYTPEKAVQRWNERQQAPELPEAYSAQIEHTNVVRSAYQKMLAKQDETTAAFHKLRGNLRSFPKEYSGTLSYAYEEVDGLFHVYSNNQTVCMSEDSEVAHIICQLINSLRSAKEGKHDSVSVSKLQNDQHQP